MNGESCLNPSISLLYPSCSQKPLENVAHSILPEGPHSAVTDLAEHCQTYPSEIEIRSKSLEVAIGKFNLHILGARNWSWRAYLVWDKFGFIPIGINRSVNIVIVSLFRLLKKISNLNSSMS